MDINTKDFEAIAIAAYEKSMVTGHTHDFYNYPARFSPIFAREAIKIFTNPGDLIVDPFMGGGTSLVESKSLNRNSIGYDISSLASFVARVKLSPLSSSETQYVKNWMDITLPKLNCHTTVIRPNGWIEKGYQRNINGKSTWPIRKLIEQFLHELENINRTAKVKDFLRCALLKTSQWALDSKMNTPSSSEFKSKLRKNVFVMCDSSKEYYKLIKESENIVRSIIRNKSSENIHKDRIIGKLQAPKLILTSPPYPGVHIVYHRWQIHGRKETPAPFWIANSKDGHGLSHYTMGGRHQESLTNYFNNIRKTFTSISQICDNQTLVIQILAFSNSEWQLPKYLEVMELSGFEEVQPAISRIWRAVPNRKWYAQNQGNTSSSKEVVLFHKLIN